MNKSDAEGKIKASTSFLVQLDPAAAEHLANVLKPLLTLAEHQAEQIELHTRLCDTYQKLNSSLELDNKSLKKQLYIAETAMNDSIKGFATLKTMLKK